MGNKGFLYVLANSCLPDLVKVGKTTRSPSDRAQELSASTGTPTPFIVVYEEYFEDCDAAEKFVHTILEEKGLREAQNKEFFRSPPKQVIETIMKAPGKTDAPTEMYSRSESQSLLGPQIEDELSDFVLEDESDLSPWVEVWEAAENAYYGVGDTIQDDEEAFDLFVKAGKLGCPIAFRRIGIMYERGEGIKRSRSQALEFFKKGAREGDYYCYFHMARLFFDLGNIENHEKAFRLFFQNRLARRSTVFEKSESIENGLAWFLISCQLDRRGYPERFREEFIGVREELKIQLQRIEEKAREKGRDEFDASVVAIAKDCLLWLNSKTGT